MVSAKMRTSGTAGNRNSSAVTIFAPEDERRVRELFDGLERPVPLELVLGPGPDTTLLVGGREIDFAAETRRIVEALADLSDALTLSVRETEEPGLYPETRIGGERVRYHGLPWGYELGTLVGGIVEAGRADSSLSEGSLAALGELPGDAEIAVYVTPT